MKEPNWTALLLCTLFFVALMVLIVTSSPVKEKRTARDMCYKLGFHTYREHTKDTLTCCDYEIIDETLHLKTGDVQTKKLINNCQQIQIRGDIQWN